MPAIAAKLKVENHDWFLTTTASPRAPTPLSAPPAPPATALVAVARAVVGVAVVVPKMPPPALEAVVAEPDAINLEVLDELDEGGE